MRKTGFFIGAVLVLAIAAVCVISLLSSRQTKFSDIDLRPARTQVPVASNAFPILVEAGRLLAVIESEQTALADLAKGSSWDEAQAREFLKANAASLTAMHAAWSRPNLQVDTVTNFDTEFPYLAEWRQLTRLALIQSQLSFQSGEEAQAFATALEVLRFGHRVEESDGGTLHYLVGAAIKSQALECLRKFADTSRLSAEDLLSVARQL